MNSLRIVAGYLWQRRLTSALNVLLLAIGVATITLLVLVTTQLGERLEREAAKIDLVVGAKGSPLQLILSAIFHVDVPTGNVPLAEVRALANHALVAAVIPLSLGDSYRGFRIVGTEAAYVELYGGRPASGRLWAKPLEVALGAEVARATGLAVGDEIVGVHGLGGGGGTHGDHRYRVVGVLGVTGSVLDRLVLTSLESVWIVHELEAAADKQPDSGKPADRDHAGPTDKAAVGAQTAGPIDKAAVEAQAAGAAPAAPADHAKHDEDADGREVTAALLRYKTPLAAASLPRAINAESRLQAASPPFELARLMAVFGVGVDAVRTLAWVLIAAASLGVFVALYQALAERQYDIAIMRTLGASRGRIVSLMLLESLLLAVPGTLLGLLLGHALVAGVGVVFPEARGLGVTGWRWVSGEGWVVAITIASGILAAILPAVRAYRLDVAATLAKG